ncbi:LysR substrate-binding domain-containing protein [Streptomyces diastatochromogenes]|nr:LysR substrate-binding domain-containing protein [Streptomyces diastatochromogenes]
MDVAVAVEYRGPRRPTTPAHPCAAVRRALRRGRPGRAPPRRRPEVPLAELAKDPWIGPYPGNPCHDVVVLACESAGFQPRLEHSSDDFRAVVALASADAGVALVPRSALRGMDLTGVVVRPVDGVAPTRRVFAAVRRGAEGHPLIRQVLQALGEAAQA